MTSMLAFILTLLNKITLIAKDYELRNSINNLSARSELKRRQNAVLANSACTFIYIVCSAFRL